MSAYIYLINIDSRSYKIGYTRNIEQRLKNIIGLIVPFEYESCTLEHSIKVNDPLRAEKYLHDKFRDKHIKGEWFRLSLLEVDWIKSLNENDLYSLMYDI